MSNLTQLLTNAVNEISECVAAGYVDISSGKLLGVNTVSSHPSSVLELVAAATADLFAGENVTAIENAFKKARGVVTGRRYFQEIIVNSDNLIHVFARAPQNEEHVAVIVCRNKVSLGLVISQTRKILPSLEAAL